MKRGFKHSISIVAGILIAVAILCSNVLFTGAHAKKDVVKTEQSSNTSEEAFNAPTLSPPSVFHVNLTLDIFCLFDLAHEPVDEAGETSNPIEPPKLLLTLFRVIIAPNAP